MKTTLFVIEREDGGWHWGPDVRGFASADLAREALAGFPGGHVLALAINDEDYSPYSPRSCLVSRHAGEASHESVAT